MLLAFNIGNTSISFGALDESGLRFRADIAAHPVRTADEYAVLLAQIFTLHGFDPTQITDVIIAVIVYLSAFSLVIQMWLAGRKKKEKVSTPTQNTDTESAQEGGQAQ